MGINLKHSTDHSENHTMYVKSKNVEALPGDDTNDIIEQLIASFLENYEDPVLESRNGSGYSYDSVEMLDIHFHKIEIKRGSSYTDSPEWLKNKGATINPRNTKDNRSFMYALTIALNHKEIGRDPQRISKLIPFILKYNRDGIDFPAGQKEWKTFERNNKDIALNILSVPYNKEKVEIQYTSKHTKSKNHVTLLMITEYECNWHYLALKSIPTDDGYMYPLKSIKRLLRGQSSKHDGDFYCMNYLHSFRSKNALKNHERLCNDHDYCEIIMPQKDKNILKYYSGTKSLKWHTQYI